MSCWTLPTSFFARRRAATAPPDKIDKPSYYSESGENWWITSGNFFATRPVAIVTSISTERECRKSANKGAAG
jgi:hypothetical protein